MARAERVFSLKGQRALVTGASRGIGRGIAIGFAEAGANMALCARSTDALEEVAEQVEKLGRRACTIDCDLTAPKSEHLDVVESCVARALAELGRIDILVNAADRCSRRRCRIPGTVAGGRKRQSAHAKSLACFNPAAVPVRRCRMRRAPCP